MATIVCIEELNDEENSEGGFLVRLNDGEEIKLWIDTMPSCCEQFGYFISEDNFNDFTGAEVLSVERVDTALKVSQVERFMHEGKLDLDGGGIMFVNINTNRGTLQFVAYNEHNGYYGHDAGVVTRYLESGSLGAYL